MKTCYELYMKLAFTPFTIETNKNKEKDLQNFLCLKEDGKPLISVTDNNLVHPYFYQDKWYVFLASNKSKHILVDIYVLTNNQLTKHDSIVIDNKDDLLITDEIYIPRLIFEEREIEIKDKGTKKYDLITFDNEEESGHYYDPNDEEYSSFFETADSLPNPMEHIRYANYVFFSTVENHSRNNCFKTLNAIELSHLSEKKYEVKEIDIELENKPLRQAIKHHDGSSRNSSFSFHSVYSVFRPEPYSQIENYLAIVEESENSAKIIENLKKQLSRVSPNNNFFRSETIDKKILIRFMTNPELFEILISRINKDDFVYINKYI